MCALNYILPFLYIPSKYRGRFRPGRVTPWVEDAVPFSGDNALLNRPRDCANSVS